MKNRTVSDGERSMMPAGGAGKRRTPRSQQPAGARCSSAVETGV
jgi:hypothetical protein